MLCRVVFVTVNLDIRVRFTERGGVWVPMHLASVPLSIGALRVQASTLMIHYVALPTPGQLDAAARLIDSTLKRPLRIRPFQKSLFFVLALNATAEVAGVAAIKKRKGNAAEIGHIAVDGLYRRQGIATRLTQIVIAEATRQRIQLLYAWVKKSNVASTGNLEKSGFCFWGNYVKRPGRSSVKSWFYLPLSTEVDCNSVMEAVTNGRTRVE